MVYWINVMSGNYMYGLHVTRVYARSYIPYLYMKPNFFSIATISSVGKGDISSIVVLYD